MNITKENIDDLNAILNVKVEKGDYQEKIDKTLSDYRKRSNIKGFRKGKAPLSFIRKQYGKSILGDELNRLVNEELNNFIDKEKLNILGYPLPKEDFEVIGDFDNPDTFEFAYEIGLAPNIEVSLSSKSKFEYTKVKVDDKLIDKQIDDLARRYGKLVSSEKVGEKDMILGQFVELTEDEEIKVGGIMNDSTISLEFIEDKDIKKELIGKKASDKVVVNPVKLSRGNKDLASMLGIKEEELDQISEKFQFTIQEIKTMLPADLNQELFDKLFGDDQVKSEDELRERIKTDMVQMFESDSDNILIRRVSNNLIEKADLKLPDAFLKRWIMANSKDPITEEELEESYDNYAKGLKWTLIKNSIYKEHGIKVEQEEIINHTKNLLVQQYQQYGLPTPDDHELTHSASHVLENQDELQRIASNILEGKLLNYLKETVKLDEKEVDYDEFLKIARDENA